MQEAECAYVIILMAVYWCTEVLPLAITALLPALLFPLFGIMESKDVSEAAACRAQSVRLSVSAHMCHSACFRCVCNTWKTQTCCLSGGWWLRLLWSTGICTSASPCECCSLLVCAQRCKWHFHTLTADSFQSISNQFGNQKHLIKIRQLFKTDFNCCHKCLPLPFFVVGL